MINTHTYTTHAFILRSDDAKALKIHNFHFREKK